MLHSACVNVMPTARTLPLCAVVGIYCIGEQWRIKDGRIQSVAVLWLRHSFARAFSGASEARFYSHTTAKPKTPCDSTMEREMLYQPQKGVDDEKVFANNRFTRTRSRFEWLRPKGRGISDWLGCGRWGNLPLFVGQCLLPRRQPIQQPPNGHDDPIVVFA